MAASCAPRLSGPARTRCPYWCAIDQALQSLQSTCRMCLCLTEGTDSTPPGKCRLSVVCVWGARVGIVYWRRSRRLCVRRLASLQRRVLLSRLVRYRAQGCVLRGVAPASGALLPCVRSSHRHEDLTHAGCVGCQVRWTQWLWACPFRRSTPRARGVTRIWPTAHLPMACDAPARDVVWPRDWREHLLHHLWETTRNPALHEVNARVKRVCL